MRVNSVQINGRELLQVRLLRQGMYEIEGNPPGFSPFVKEEFVNMHWEEIIFQYFYENRYCAVFKATEQIHYFTRMTELYYN